MLYPSNTQPMNTLRLFSIMAICLLFTLSQQAHAQLEKGRSLYGGSANVELPNVRNGVKSGASFLEARYGYFLGTKVAIGPMLQHSLVFSTFNRGTNSEFKTRVRTLALGAFFRPYLIAHSSRWNIFGEVVYQYGFIKEIANRTGVEVVRRTTSNYGRAALGLSIYVQPNVALECNYGLERFRLKDEDKTQFRQRITFGFIIYPSRSL